MYKCIGLRIQEINFSPVSDEKKIFCIALKQLPNYPVTEMEALLCSLYQLQEITNPEIFSLPLNTHPEKPNSLLALMDLFKDGGDGHLCPKIIRQTINAYIQKYDKQHLQSIQEEE